MKGRENLGKREIYNYENPKFAPLRAPMREAMRALLNAERYFAAIKEVVWGRFGMKYLSDAIHSLEHEQLGRIDQFGGTLHQLGLDIEYPATAELDEPLGDLDEVFRVCVEIVDNVEEALSGFIRKADELGCYAQGREAENLQIQNSADRTKLLEAWSMWDNGVSASSFDKYAKLLFGGEEDG